jgi:cysteine desulfuration protein SufE
MSDSLLRKIRTIQQLFSACDTPQARYEQLIALGQRTPPLDPIHKTEANRVHGCQSTLYLVSTLQNGSFQLAAHADALISNGLAALLITLYQGETPETILRHPPRFLESLGLAESLSMTRLQGLASIYQALQRRAVAALA